MRQRGNAGNLEGDAEPGALGPLADRYTREDTYISEDPMSIAACAIAEAAIAFPAGTDKVIGPKIPPKRQTVARADAPLLPEAR